MSQHQRRKIFAIIGAGPKGIAVAVKAKVLQEFGFDGDHVILIEKNKIAAHWSGEFGYTNGEMKLGTSPEKDVVYPIETDVGDDALNARIRARLLHFSWTSFLVQTGNYADWVDRGRLAPRHRLWASYLQWVAEQLTPHVSIVYAEVIKIDLTQDEKRWELALQTSTKKNWSIEADRLMLTGPGKPQMDFVNQHDRSLSHATYDLETFWHALKEKTFSDSGKIAIIGAGEHAASLLLALSQYAPQLSVDVISPKGFISTRAESYYENHMYSDPDKNGWKMLNIADRLDFINRTDLGVFSVHAMNILDDEIQHKIIPGRVVSLKSDGQVIYLNLIYHQKSFTRMYDQVILATGFDQITLLKSLLSQRAHAAVARTIGSSFTQQTIVSKIDSDLSLHGMQPYLHLPMLAGLMQGPGFANLSCLGRLSDRLITSFVNKQAQHLSQQVIPFYQRQNNDKSCSLC